MLNRFNLNRIYRLAPQQAITSSFLVVILLGTVLLMLPQASTRTPLGFIDALFMATSATCVTGLVVVDPGSQLTPFGQAVILGLIQVGGLGIMALSTFFVLMLGGSFSIRGRKILQETLADFPLKELGTLVRSLVIMTVVIELAGAVFLYLRFRALELPNALWSAVFHSVSAFCNAGFSLNANSFESYRGDAIVTITLMILIILGGLGFLVLAELLMRARGKGEKTILSLHTRLVLSMTAVLIFGGAGLYALFEAGRFWQNGFPSHVWFLESLFQSVTARTAGFNTIPIASLANPTLLLLMVLMFIGAAPGSTAGGVKITTVAVIFALLRTRIHRDEDDVTLMGRTIPQRIISKSVAIIVCMTVLLVVVFGCLLITEVEDPSNRQRFIPLLFESVSALGTVGLSMGATTALSTAGKLILTATMVLGRLGPLTLALAVGRTTQKSFLYQYPEENVMVG